MKLLRSVALSVLFPESRDDASAFEHALAFLSAWPLDSVEFFFEGQDKPRVARALAASGLNSIYIAVIPLKGQNLSLCSPDEQERQKALALVRQCSDDARLFGCQGIMVNSGRHPGKDLAEKALSQFGSSVESLHTYLHNSGQPMKLLLEPCDSSMDARNLLGPNRLATALTRQLRARCPDFALTLDTAHMMEEGEDFLAELKDSTDCCDHIHFANCFVSDASDPMYGDKHVGFDYPGSAFPPEVLHNIFQEIKKIYGGRTCRIALEILCREPDPQGYFRKVAAQIPWFFG